MVGRREKPIDPCAPFAIFADGLRALRAASGKTLQQIGAEKNYSIPALSMATAGIRLPSLEVTLAIVQACGGNEDDWKLRWEREAQTRR